MLAAFLANAAPIMSWSYTHLRTPPYSLMVLLLSNTLWSLPVFNHKKVSSVVNFFWRVSNISGMINVLLFLIVRPKLVRSSPPDEVCEPA